MEKRETHTIDATGKILGRLATQIAILLRGKHKPSFQPNKDLGDFVIVKNVDKIRVTGKKMEKKKYYRHSEYMGGLKEISLKEFFAKNPDQVLKLAVQRMMPRNKLARQQIKRLKIK
jgi:large subunit ribosomal protein L13